MVEFAWSWKNYERCKRAEERKAARNSLDMQGVENKSEPGANARIPLELAAPSRCAAPALGPAKAKTPPAGGFMAAFDKIMQAEREKRQALAAQQADLQACDLCGKRRRTPCADRGCPIL